MNYLTWDHRDHPVVADEPTLIRWAQARGERHVKAWRLVAPGAAEEINAVRHGDVWELATPNGLVHDRVAADDVDDPGALVIVNYLSRIAEALPEHRRVRLDDWDSVDEDEPNYKLFGYTRPDHTACWSYCPELIAHQTAEMGDDELTRYLEGIVVRLYLAWEMRDTDRADREARIEGALAILNPAVDAIMLDWQLKILDER